MCSNNNQIPDWDLISQQRWGVFRDRLGLSSERFVAVATRTKGHQVLGCVRVIPRCVRVRSDRSVATGSVGTRSASIPPLGLCLAFPSRRLDTSRHNLECRIAHGKLQEFPRVIGDLEEPTRPTPPMASPARNDSAPYCAVNRLLSQVCAKDEINYRLGSRRIAALSRSERAARYR